METTLSSRTPRPIGRWLLIGFGIALIATVVWIFLVDVSLPEHADLVIEPHSIEEGPNAFDDLVQAGNAIIAHPTHTQWRQLVQLIDQYARPRSGQGWDLETNRDMLRSALEDLTSVSEQIERALARGRCVPPSHIGAPLGVLHGAEQAFRQVGSFLHIRAGVALCEGRPEEALESSLDQIRFVAMLRRDARSIGITAVATEIERRGWRDLRALAALETFDAGACARALEVCLPLLESLETPIEDVLRSEYTWIRQLILDHPGEVGLKPHRTIERLGEFFRVAIAQEALPAAERTMIRAGLDGRADSLTGNRKGSGYLTLATSIHRMLLRERPICQFERQGTLLLFALRAHEFRRGARPESLAALVPEFLPSVPADPFSGEPMKYYVKNGWVWSVGRDGIDSGGNPQPLYTDETEPTITIWEGS